MAALEALAVVGLPTLATGAAAAAVLAAAAGGAVGASGKGCDADGGSGVGDPVPGGGGVFSLTGAAAVTTGIKRNCPSRSVKELSNPFHSASDRTETL